MSASAIVTVIIGEDAPPRLDKALARDAPEAAGLSRSRLAKLIAGGAVTRAGEVLTTPSRRVAPGEEIEIALAPPEEIAARPEPIPLDILHEDADLIVLAKPAGMVVHPAPGAAAGTLVNALLHHCAGGLSGIGGRLRPGIVHRLDKDTSGALVAAKSDRAHQGLAAQFAAHSVTRSYTGLCHGVFDAAEPRLRGMAGTSFEPGGSLRIETRIGRHPADRQRQAVLPRGGRHAVTRAAVAERFGTPPAAARLTCRLETGRTHQIRVHLAHIGHGLIGDPVYGGRRLSAKAAGAGAAAAAAAFPRQALHAGTLGFVHPVSGEALAFSAPLPADMAALLTALRGGSEGGA